LAGSGIIAPQLSSSAHLHRWWRANKREPELLATFLADGGYPGRCRYSKFFYLFSLPFSESMAIKTTCLGRIFRQRLTWNYSNDSLE
jgi:hypothetical protein